jgi:hypothetical protein
MYVEFVFVGQRWINQSLLEQRLFELETATSPSDLYIDHLMSVSLMSVSLRLLASLLEIALEPRVNVELGRASLLRLLCIPKVVLPQNDNCRQIVDIKMLASLFNVP